MWVQQLVWPDSGQGFSWWLKAVLMETPRWAHLSSFLAGVYFSIQKKQIPDAIWVPCASKLGCGGALCAGCQEGPGG